MSGDAAGARVRHARSMLRRALLVPAVATLATTAPLHAQTLRGLLLDRDTQQPIQLGTVTMITEGRDSVAATLTDDRGFFDLDAPDDGRYSLVGSALGYRGSLVGPYELREGDVQVVQLLLGPRPVLLPGIVVSAERLSEPEIASLVATGFYDRMLDGKGEFLTPGEIARSTVAHTPQLFREMQLVELAPALGTGTGPWNDRVMIRFLDSNTLLAGMTPEERRIHREAQTRSEFPLEKRLCAPRVFVDGRYVIPLDHESFDDLVPKEELEAVEVYQAPFGAPMSYQGTSGCGVVLLWTKRRGR